MQNGRTFSCTAKENGNCLANIVEYIYIPTVCKFSDCFPTLLANSGREFTAPPPNFKSSYAHGHSESLLKVEEHYKQLTKLAACPHSKIQYSDALQIP